MKHCSGSQQICADCFTSKVSHVCRWAALIVYITEGDLTIDNNLAENALRPIAVGRKNRMFARSESDGDTIAIISSIISTCRRAKVDPFAYLKTVINKLYELPDIDVSLLIPDILHLDF